MWEWILLVLVILAFGVFVLPGMYQVPPPGCKACAKKSENPAQ